MKDSYSPITPVDISNWTLWVKLIVGTLAVSATITLYVLASPHDSITKLSLMIPFSLNIGLALFFQERRRLLVENKERIEDYLNGRNIPYVSKMQKQIKRIDYCIALLGISSCVALLILVGKF